MKTSKESAERALLILFLIIIFITLGKFCCSCSSKIYLSKHDCQKALFHPTHVKIIAWSNEDYIYVFKNDQDYIDFRLGINRLFEFDSIKNYYHEQYFTCDALINLYPFPR